MPYFLLAAARSAYAVFRLLRDDFEGFRSAWGTRCTDMGEISPPSVQGWGVGPKTKHFTQISVHKR